jgi:hypothetical protein
VILADTRPEKQKAFQLVLKGFFVTFRPQFSNTFMEDLKKLASINDVLVI